VQFSDAMWHSASRIKALDAYYARFRDMRVLRPVTQKHAPGSPPLRQHDRSVTAMMHIVDNRSMRKFLESWSLFGLLAFGISAANCAALPFTDFQTARGAEFIVLYSVRCALPLFVVSFTASSLAIIWPSRYTRWLLVQRRYFGLAFAFGMAWHLAFVLYVTVRFGNQLNRIATALDLVGFVFLAALTLTSFRWFGRRLTPVGWRRVHKMGVYVIWLLATFIYLANVRGGADLLHAVALGIFIAAWLLRLIAWAKWRHKKRAGGLPPRDLSVHRRRHD
jgi:sulfoxide reductase heme-binding subunit YedZ